MARNPEESDWLRAETLADELLHLSAEKWEGALARLESGGEPRFILELVRGLLTERPSRPVFQPGTTVNGYTLLSVLGEGSMGTVWRARQEWIEREVALKVIHTHLFSADRRERFLREMQTLGKLSHPGIVQIYGAGLYESPGNAPMPFFTMELIEGLPLDQWAANQSERPGPLLRVMAGVCAAVQYAHDRRIVHRDLKPANILVRTDGRPVVLDFGIARLVGAEMNDASGGFEGTPLYAAPEQFSGRDAGSPPVFNDEPGKTSADTHETLGIGRVQDSVGLDLYAIGVILFEQFSGRFPFDIQTGASLWSIRQAKLEGRVVRLGEAWPECPPVLDEIISRTVRREAIDRVYSTVAELGRALDTAASRLVLDYSIPPPWRPATEAVIPRTNWKLERKIGVGGAGEVWLGRHDQLNIQRVFKFCDTEEKARTLRRELTVYRMLRERIGQNPHFVPLVEVSLAEPPWYLMMEHVDAVDLITWCAAIPGGANSLPLDDRIEIIAQVAEALQAAHEAGILHRDLKPANLLVRGKPFDGMSPPHVLIADFGIGQIVADEAIRSGGQRSGFTRTVSELARSTISGTLFYLAPEVLGGQAATARSDIYSLGVIFWQLLLGNFETGLYPLDWEAQVPDGHVRSDLARCLAGKPDDRWASAGELAQSLRQLPQRRMAEEMRRKAAELGERRAYWRGVALTAGFATLAVLTFAILAWQAIIQRRSAEQRLGENDIQRMVNFERTELQPGRRKRGLALWEQASRRATNTAALRSTAAIVLGLSDLESRSVRFERTNRLSDVRGVPDFWHEEGETARTRSNNGRWLAVARDRNGIDGSLELVDLSLHTTNLLQWTNFPWMPIGEPGLLRFSPGTDRLAIGGGQTSRNLLLLKLPEGQLETFLFHPSDPLSCAWHPAGRLLATGNEDHTILLWDTHLMTHPRQDGPVSGGITLPPESTTPAIDRPIFILRSHRYPVRFLSFSTDGRWLVSIDSSGALQIHPGLQTEVPTSQPTDGSNSPEIEIPLMDEVLAEWNIQDPTTIAQLSFHGDELRITRESGSVDSFTFLPTRLPTEQYVNRGVNHVAWTPKGNGLCVITSGDILWMDGETLTVQDWQANMNVDDVVTDPTSGALRFGQIVKVGSLGNATGDRLRACLRISQKTHASEPEPIEGLDSFEISSQDILPMLGTDDGRFAIRVGRQVAFFKGNTGSNALKVTKLGKEGDVVQDWFWDSHGTIFGMVLGSPHHPRLNVWLAKGTGDLPDFTSFHELRLTTNSVTVAANDGVHVVIRNPDRGVAIYCPKPEDFRVIDSSSFARQKQPMAASHDGRFLAMVSDSHRIRLLELPTGKFFAEFVSHRRAPIRMVAWNADRQQLASVTEDGYIQLWALSEWWKLLADHHLLDGQGVLPSLQGQP